MGFWFEFDPTNKILLGRFAGRLTDHSLSEYYSAVRKYARATDARAGIFDLSLVTEIADIHQTRPQPGTARTGDARPP